MNECSRIFVKDLPKYVTQQRLNKLINERMDSYLLGKKESCVITDVKLMKKPNGISRRIGFIGLSNSLVTDEFCRYLDKSFIDTARIRCFIAKSREEAPKYNKPIVESVNTKYIDAKTNDNSSVKTFMVKKFKSGTSTIRKHTIYQEDDPKELESSKEKIGTDINNNNNSVKIDDKLELSIKKTKLNTSPGYYDKNTELIDDPTEPRLVFFCLPLTTNELKLRQLCEPVGEVSDVMISRVGKETVGYVTFRTIEQTKFAYDKLKNNNLMQGKYVTIKYAKPYNKITKIINKRQLPPPTSFSQKRMEEKIQSAVDEKSCLHQPIYLDSYISITAMALSLDSPQSKVNLAVKSTLAEAQIVEEIKNWLSDKKVALVKEDIKQISKKVILVKNLHPGTTKSQLLDRFSFFGVINDCVLSPYSLMALLEYNKERSARRAFTALAYFNFNGRPLYLEWAPFNATIEDESNENTIEEISDENKIENIQYEEDTSNNPHPVLPPNSDTNKEPNKILYISNVSCSTDREKFIEIVSKNKGYLDGGLCVDKLQRSSTSSKKHLGYGFATFSTLEDSAKAMKNLSNLNLDNYIWKVEFSKQRTMSYDVSSTVTKLIIKNLPFQTNLNDLKLFLGSFGDIKSVRLPKNSRNECRGFAFAEFHTNKGAIKVKSTLSGVHFLGRPLIIEPSNE